MVVLVLAALLGLIPASIAKGKGRSFGLWWLYGAAIFIVALPHALIMSSRSSRTDEINHREMESQHQPRLSISNMNSEFNADGVIGGIPYRMDGDGTFLALMGGSTIRFKNRQDLESAVAYKAA